MASALSKKFETFKQTRQMHETIAEVRKISLSQLFASIGNLIWVIPLTVLFDLIWLWAFGHHILSPEEAQSIIQKHDPFHSMTIFYAALTGVLLWLSSVVAGWTENWIVYRNIPSAIISSPLISRRFTPKKLEEFASGFAATMGGIAGNISIAFFLATPIIIGKLTGLPLDIRHITLAAGTMTLGLTTMGWTYAQLPDIAFMSLSVILIGGLNFGISFYFAIRMAALPRNVDSKYLKVLFKYSFTKRRLKSLELD
jgi:site-specific recombinase